MIRDDIENKKRIGDKKNCPNCGAVITDTQCPYCGTYFIDFACMEIGKPFWLKVKNRKGVVNIIRVKLENIYEDMIQGQLYAEDEIVEVLNDPKLHMDFSVMPEENGDGIYRIRFE